ncbi:MAG: aromatic ring-hydroxylating dioxygenase subunit alpha [Gammaproteobacteria bacterium]|jgi:phenylpropionate dioxygenase-like ring-hydroxylating dioxygenase large terminal subunit|nr:aromatic ring-hydroxylating dioxygenase subunit alpha [Gammaproteobacteria bacterium]
MALVEKEFLARENPKDGLFKAPPFLPRAKNKGLGLERLGGERYLSSEFMRAEWENIWTKTWQLVTRVDDFEEAGSFFVHELGKESFLFVRGDDQIIRGFYNVCQHRGNRLCITDSGILDTFTCPFHGWQWNSDGTIKQVAAPEFFRQFDDGIPEETLGLVPVKVEQWGGWLFFTMDPEACPLKTYLGEIGEHLESYEFQNWHLVDYQTFEWDGNWKHAVDAFNESYHFAALHPDMIEFGEGHDIPIELWGIHSRMLNWNRTVSEIVPDRDTITPLRAHMMNRRMQQTGSNHECAAKDIHLAEIRHRRAIENDTHLPFEQMNDEQLVHQYHYTFFPNTTFTQTPEGGAVFRYRPHATDPAKCYYDFFIMSNPAPGEPRNERPPHKIHRHAPGSNYSDVFDGTFEPILANVLAQDGSNMPTMQAGVASDSFKGMLLSDQEIRLRHFHKIVDDFIAKNVDTHNLPSWDHYLDKDL